MTKIVFFVEAPFGERNYNRYGIEILQKNGFDVEVWDFTPFLHPDVHQRAKVLDNFAVCKQFPTQREALAAVSRLQRSCFVMCLIAYRYETVAIYRALSSVQSGYCLVVTNAVPGVSVIKDRKYILARILQLLRSAPLKLLMKALLSHIPFRYLGIRPATVLLAGGEQSVRHMSNRPVNGETKILWAHTRDYDLYLNEKDKPVSVDTNMGVFLDEYSPFHPDYEKWEYPPDCSEEKYYPSLRRFFEFLEREYGVRIVIAAHPQSRYENCNYFGGREVQRGKTIDLVRQAGFVIAHSSTSLSFAVLFRKPVLFITTDEFQQSRLAARLIRGTATCLNKAPINVDAPLQLDWAKELTVDRDAYVRYREAYIKKSGSPEQQTWQILADFVKTL